MSAYHSLWNPGSARAHPQTLIRGVMIDVGFADCSWHLCILRGTVSGGVHPESYAKFVADIIIIHRCGCSGFFVGRLVGGLSLAHSCDLMLFLCLKLRYRETNIICERRKYHAYAAKPYSDRQLKATTVGQLPSNRGNSLPVADNRYDIAIPSILSIPTDLGMTKVLHSHPCDDNPDPSHDRC